MMVTSLQNSPFEDLNVGYPDQIYAIGVGNADPYMILTTTNHGEGVYISTFCDLLRAESALRAVLERNKSILFRIEPWQVVSMTFNEAIDRAKGLSQLVEDVKGLVLLDHPLQLKYYI